MAAVFSKADNVLWFSFLSAYIIITSSAENVITTITGSTFMEAGKYNFKHL